MFLNKMDGQVMATPCKDGEKMTHLDQLKTIDAAWMNVLGAAVQMQEGESSDAFLQAIERMEQARMHAGLPSFSELMQSYGYSIVPMSSSAVQ